MSKLVEKALELLTQTVNLSTGISHFADEDAAKDLFLRLHKKKEILLKAEIESWAIQHGWQPRHAEELGSLAQQIGEGKKVRLSRKESPWLEDVLDSL